MHLETTLPEHAFGKNSISWLSRDGVDDLDFKMLEYEHKPMPHIVELENSMDAHFFLSASLSQASFTQLNRFFSKAAMTHTWNPLSHSHGTSKNIVE